MTMANYRKINIDDLAMRQQRLFREYRLNSKVLSVQDVFELNMVPFGK